MNAEANGRNEECKERKQQFNERKAVCCARKEELKNKNCVQI